MSTFIVPASTTSPRLSEEESVDTDETVGGYISSTDQCPASTTKCTTQGGADSISTSSGTLPKSFQRIINDGLDGNAYSLVLFPETAGGTYMVREDSTKEPLFIFKPSLQEQGLEANPHGNTESERNAEFPPGSGYLRERAAYLLDHGHFANVPETQIGTVNGLIGSIQRFVPRCTESWSQGPVKFSIEDVHHIGALDIRLLNGDRHGGNILVRSISDSPSAGSSALVPIDHSYVLPPCFADPDFEWKEWPQAKRPFSQSTLDYIAALDVEHDAILVAGLLGEEAGHMIAITTTVLKHCAARGYTLAEIASFCRRETLTQPSKLEDMIADCAASIDEGAGLDVQLASRLLQQLMPGV